MNGSRTESAIGTRRAGIASPLVLLAIVSLAMALWPAPSAHAAGDFLPQKSYPAGDTPSSVAVGDFNADGDPDLAVVNATPDTVSVLRGQAGGSFGGPTPYSAVGASSVVTGDFNADGDPDLAVANYSGHSVSVLLGAAGGGFGAPTSYAAGNYPYRPAVGDFNADGDPDLAVVNVHSQTVSVLPGEAGGAFGAPTPYPVGVSPEGVSVGEFNADGDPDLAVSNAGSDTVSVLVGGAGAGFEAQATYGVGDVPEAIAIGNYNGDGDPDLAVPNAGSDNVSVLSGGPGAGFGAPTVYRVGNEPLSLAAGDFNADGDPDLAAANLVSDNVSVLRGGAGAGFGAQTVYPVGDTPFDIEVGDFNADGDPDLAVATYASDAVSVLLGTPIGFSPSSVAFGSHPDSTEHARTVTLENNSGQDLAVAGVALRGTDITSFGIRAGDDGCTGATVPNGGACAVTVRFHPDGVGPKSAHLRFTDDAITSPQTVELSGTGTPGPWLTRSVQGLKFGRVPVGTTTAAKQVTFTNTGSAPMQISSISLEGANPGDFVGLSETCTALASLGPDESCSAQVAFKPTATGSRAARLKVTDTAPGSPHYVQLSGTGT